MFLNQEVAESAFGILLPTVVASEIILKIYGKISKSDKASDNTMIFGTSLAIGTFSAIIMSLLVSSINLTNIACIIAGVYGIYLICSYITEAFKSKNRIIPECSFFAVASLIFLVSIVMGIRPNQSYYIRMNLIDGIKHIISGEGLMHFLYHFLIYIPFGVTFALMKPKKYTSFHYIIVGVLFASVIEMMQLLFRVGEVGITDIIAGTAGCFVGLLIIRILFKKNVVKAEEDDPEKIEVVDAVPENAEKTEQDKENIISIKDYIDDEDQTEEPGEEQSGK